MGRVPAMSGIILYRGPSMLDGSPIVCIATGIEGKASRNGKAGEMVQTWILREDIAPHEAIHTAQTFRFAAIVSTGAR